jgi:hypothetical protein
VCVAARAAASRKPLHEGMLEQIGRMRRHPPSEQQPAAMRRSNSDLSSAPGWRTTEASKACENSRPIAAAICASSLAEPPSRSSRAMSEACRLAGTASAGDGTAASARSVAVSLPASNIALVISSTNKGIPSVRSMMSCRMLADSRLLPTMRSIMAPASRSASRLMMMVVK